MIDDLAENAKEELKRADHSLYVTLKYTRTVDVIKNTIKRLISAFDLAILELNEFLKTKKKLKVVPTIAKLRAEIVAEYLSKMKKFIDFYFMLKSIDKAEYDKKEEYRKNVALIAFVDVNKPVQVDIETLKGFYRTTAEFVVNVEEIIHQG